MDINRANEILNQFLDGKIGFPEFNAQAERGGFLCLEVFQEIRARGELQCHPEMVPRLSVGAPIFLDAQKTAEWALDAAVFKRVEEYKKFMPVSPVYSVGMGFQNIGNTCFMNAALQGFLARIDIQNILAKELTRIPLESDASFRNKQRTLTRNPGEPDAVYAARQSRLTRNGETDADFQARNALKYWLIVLYRELAAERGNQQTIAQCISQIARNPLFAGKLNIGVSQEDADEFLRILMDALELGGDYSPTALNFLSHFGDRFEPGAPIIQLGTELEGDVSIASLFSDQRLAHRNLGAFTGISVHLPRTRVDHRAIRVFRKIQGLLFPIICSIYDGVVGQWVRRTLIPDAIVCHHGGSFGGHYVTVVRKQDASGRPYYIEKNDSYVRVLSEEEANQIVETSACTVHYSASVGTVVGRTGISSQG